MKCKYRLKPKASKILRDVIKMLLITIGLITCVLVIAFGLSYTLGGLRPQYHTIGLYASIVLWSSLVIGILYWFISNLEKCETPINKGEQ